MRCPCPWAVNPPPLSSVSAGLSGSQECAEGKNATCPGPLSPATAAGWKPRGPGEPSLTQYQNHSNPRCPGVYWSYYQRKGVTRKGAVGCRSCSSARSQFAAVSRRYIPQLKPPVPLHLTAHWSCWQSCFLCKCRPTSMCPTLNLSHTGSGCWKSDLAYSVLSDNIHDDFCTASDV